MMLRHFDVCSGIGGFSLGFRWAALSEPVAFCEIDPYCQKVLAKNFPNIPIFNDVKELVNDRPESTRTIPDHDILTSGYPCQPFSVAGQTKCYTTWKVKVTPHKRLLYQLVALMHPTSVIDSGLWATPNTMDHLPPRSEEATKKLQEGHRKGRAKPSNLREQVDEKTMALWPTPRARDYKDSINIVPPSVQKGTRSPTLGQKVAETRMWPTPNAWDGNRGPRSEKNLQEKNHMVNLITAVQTDQRKNEQEVGGTLNPMWVEWLMGYPPGWTDLED